MRQIISPLDGIRSPFGARQGFSPVRLFGLNEPGIWLDPSDLSTMYQDRAGSTAVTTPGQSVGLRLDKSKGLVLGSELVTNGDFSGGTTGWGAFSGTIAVSNGEIVLTANAGTAFPQATQTLSGLTAGRTYLMVASARRGTSVDDAYISPAGGLNVRTSSTSPTQLRVCFTASGTTQAIALGIFSGAANGTVIFDNISVKELPGNHAVANSDAARGIYGIEPAGGRRNLLEWTEDFSNAYWTKSAASISGDTLTENTANAEHRLLRNFTAVGGVQYTLSFDVRSGTGSRNLYAYQLNGANGWSVIVNPATGAIVSSAAIGAGVGSASVTPLPGSWFRVSIVFTPASASLFLSIGMADGTNGLYLGDGVSTVRVRNAQLETGTTATAYQRVTTQYDVTEAGKQTLHYVQYDGSDDGYVTPTISPNLATSDGAARRNLLTVPSMFDDAAWTKNNSTISANSATAPDGTMTADKLQETAATASFSVAQAPTMALSTTHTLSVYMKAAERNFGVLNIFTGAASCWTWFNLSAGTVGTVGSGATASISDAGNGWYRCSLTIATAASGSPNIAMWPSTTNGTLSYAGTAGSGILLWGAQLELGTTATAFQNIGTDKVQVFAGVRKLSDAAFQSIVELSAHSDLNTGSFCVGASTLTGDASRRTWATVLSGTQVAVLGGAAVYPAPDTRIITVLNEIAQPTSATEMVMRLNGVAQTLTFSPNSAGTGNFNAYPLYIGRRGATSNPFNGRDYGIITRFGANLDASTIAATEIWLNQKTGAY